MRMDPLDLFPLDASADERGHLWLGGCSAALLSEEFGTPLYVLDEATLRTRCREYQQALTSHYPGRGRVAYAGKACLNLALAQLLAQEGVYLDVVSGGELHVARLAGFPAERIHFHGNNKSLHELTSALDEGVGRIVVDNWRELELLEKVCAERPDPLPIWLRLSPAIDVHTHDYRKTGLLDSKFGFTLETRPGETPLTSDAGRALLRALESPSLEPVGLHAHIGSQILETGPFVLAASRLIEFAALMRAAHGFDLRELSPGGGWGVAYGEADSPAPLDRYVSDVCAAVVEGCRQHKLALPSLVVEPGRSVVAPAGVALYRVGARKEIPGVRTYIAVDGGMADNIRPALYGARYTALAVERAGQPAEETVTIVGRFCESGDVLVRDIDLPRLAAGDLLAIPRVGAYCLPLASNYNLVPRPAVVLVRDGKATLIQRRETLDDLVARDLPLPAEWGT